MEKKKKKRVHKIILCEFKDLQEPATQLCRLKFQFFFVKTIKRTFKSH